MSAIAGMRPIQCVSDSYGRWWYTPPAAEGQQVRASVGPFSDRGDAMHSIVSEYPGYPVVMDGVTVGAAKPPPLPVIDRAAERERAGLAPLRTPGPPPAATQPRGTTVIKTEPVRPATPHVDGEPRSYGQGAEFERIHGPEAGRLAEGVAPTPGAVSDDDGGPVAAAQARARAMQDALARARGE